jgi:hypothetical protein
LILIVLKFEWSHFMPCGGYGSTLAMTTRRNNFNCLVLQAVTNLENKVEPSRASDGGVEGAKTIGGDDEDASLIAENKNRESAFQHFSRFRSKRGGAPVDAGAR